MTVGELAALYVLRDQLIKAGFVKTAAALNEFITEVRKR